MYLEEHFKGLKNTHPCLFIHVEIRDILLTDPPVHYQNENKPTNQGPLWIIQPLLARRKTILEGVKKPVSPSRGLSLLSEFLHTTGSDGLLDLVFSVSEGG